MGIQLTVVYCCSPPCRHSWRKWPGSNQMLTKSPRHTKGRLLRSPRSSLRSPCWTKEELEVCIPSLFLIEYDPSHLAMRWITSGWHDILNLPILAPGMMSVWMHSSWLYGGNTVILKFFVFPLQENVLPRKRCMRHQHKLPLKQRTHGLTCWWPSGSTCGCWLWTEGGNSMMLWTDWRR